MNHPIHRRKSRIVALAAVAAAAAAAAAAGGVTQFTTEVSTDGGLTWASGAVSVSTNYAGASVRVIARSMVKFVPAAGDPAFDKLLSSRHQPQVTNLVAADAVVTGFNSTSLVTPNFSDGFSAAADLGRAFGATTVSAVIAHRPNSSSLHFAEAVATGAPGSGTGANNQSGAAGVNCAQNTTSLPSINVYSDIPLFYYAVDLVAPGTLYGSRTVNFDVPSAGVGLRGAPPSQFRGVLWGYNDPATGTLTSVNVGLTDSTASAVTISYVPAPGAAVLLGLSGLLTRRRRRGTRRPG